MAISNTISDLTESITAFMSELKDATSNAAAAKRARKLSTTITRQMKTYRAESVAFHLNAKSRKAEIMAKVMAELAAEDVAEDVAEDTVEGAAEDVAVANA